MPLAAKELPEWIGQIQNELSETGRKLVEVECILAEPFIHDAEIVEIEKRPQELDLALKTEVGMD